jgi:NAD(P)H dehydrogenase (quinone)
MASSMRAFLDQTGQIWLQGGLVGKVGSVFTSTATGGGNESTILTFWPYLAHQGMIIAGLPYTSQGLLNITEVRGGSPYGAATIAGADGARQPTALELQMAREQGRHVAEIAAKLRR